MKSEARNEMLLDIADIKQTQGWQAENVNTVATTSVGINSYRAGGVSVQHTKGYISIKILV